MKILIIINLLLLSACSIKKVDVIILGCNPSVIEIYNEKKLLLKDSLIYQKMNGVSKAFITRYNFSDSIYVKIKTFEGRLRVKSTKLSRNKYIYIECDGVELKVYDTNKRKRSI